MNSEIVFKYPCDQNFAAVESNKKDFEHALYLRGYDSSSKEVIGQNSFGSSYSPNPEISYSGDLKFYKIKITRILRTDYAYDQTYVEVEAN